MPPHPSPLPRLLVWKVFRLKPQMAAIRHRALFPMIGLDKQGWSSVVLERDQTLKDWSKAGVLILSNSYRDDDVALAQAAAAAGVPVIVDICDNVFIGDIKGERGGRQRGNFVKIAKLSSAITVPSSTMGEIVAAGLEAEVPIRVIPDQSETLEETRAAFNVEPWLESNGALRQWSFKDQRARLLKRAKRRLGLKREPDFPAAQPTPPREPGRKRIVWFGHHGEFGKSGLWALADVLPEIEAAAQQVPLELLVVSNSEEKFRDLIAPARFPTAYTSWHPFQVFSDIESADLCIVPNARDSVTLAKSAGRAVMALGLGVPVIATLVPALEPLRGGLFDRIDSAEIVRALTDAAECRRRLSLGRSLVAQTFSGPAVAGNWNDLLLGLTVAQSPAMLSQKG